MLTTLRFPQYYVFQTIFKYVRMSYVKPLKIFFCAFLFDKGFL